MKTVFIIPPFSQINTAYPSVTFLSGFLQSEGYESYCSDLSLNVTLSLFSSQGLKRIFKVAEHAKNLSDENKRILHLREKYISLIDTVISFMQGKNRNFAYRLIQDNFLPQGPAFLESLNEDFFFGNFSQEEKAKFYCSKLLEDLSRFIQSTINPHFGLSRYAEKIAVSAPEFNPFEKYLSSKKNILDLIIEEETQKIITKLKPEILGYSIPFPGNLLGALVSSKWVRTNFPEIKIIYGGGYINTELRKLKDSGIFLYTDFITYDDGEIPAKKIIHFLSGKIKKCELVRTAVAESGKVKHINPDSSENIRFNDLPHPSLKGLEPDKYISVTEILNPMLNLWTDGYSNKLSAAHGCYWHKCNFCDVSLDYISRYDCAEASTIADRMEIMMKESGSNTFHFTDEAAPPALLKALCLEILKRKLTVSWWGNIRFEKSFNNDLCRLLAESGCIAVSGGLEIADDRILKLINKGVTTLQVAEVCSNFRKAGIFVHAYLMYGFPGETDKETINSLELVRQFFELDIINSAFWHRFALTINSPVAKNPENFNIKITSGINNPFANNELSFIDLSGNNPDVFSKGLNKSLYNYLHKNLINEEPKIWFDFPVPKTDIPKNYVKKHLQNCKPKNPQNAKCVWSGSIPEIVKTNSANAKVTVHSSASIGEWKTNYTTASWIKNLAEKSIIKQSGELPFFSEFIDIFPGGETEFKPFSQKNIWKEIRDNFLIFV
ncbi:MAG: radical SAM protein [Ignavibacteria bacterium]|nr:radical SAM protein [Ignavibacteria bacterium]